LETKSDLAHGREVSYAEAKKWASSKKMNYFETSAKEFLNIDMALTQLAYEVMMEKFKRDQRSLITSCAKEKSNNWFVFGIFSSKILISILAVILISFLIFSLLSLS